MRGKITFIGSGNLAFHLATTFDLAGYQIHQVISRNEATGKALAKQFAAFFSLRLEDVYADADFIFLSIPDKEIESSVKRIKTDIPVFVHCAGSCPLETISNIKTNTGVLYPLQTFSKNRPVNFFEIPVFTEASNKFSTQKINELAETISNKVTELDSEKRRYLHLAAVIANNFTNHLLAQSEKIMTLQNLPFTLLKPLVEETVKKAFELSPLKSQTGPARRNDESTIAKHQEMLENDPEIKALYQIISDSIASSYK